MLAWLAEVELRIGLWHEAAGHAEEGLRAARDIGHKARFADFESLLALIAAARGDRPGCVHHAELAMACPLRNVLGIEQARWAMGLMHLADTDHELAAEYLMAIRHDHVKRAALADTVEALVRLGDVEQATRLTAEINENAALQHRCRALLSGDEKEFQLALDHSLPFDRARTALLYGQWLRRERRIKEAKAVLRLGHDLFTQLGARPWAERSGAEIRACGGIAAPDGELTPQEHEIAHLAATGLSNREIGARLFLSHRTVGYHLHKIFRKLGIANRSQLRAHCGPKQSPST
jgi:DNA-binding CsgD family transcriptional regulator